MPVGSMSDEVLKDAAQYASDGEVAMNNQWLHACEEGDGAACSHMARSSSALSGLLKQARCSLGFFFAGEIAHALSSLVPCIPLSLRACFTVVLGDDVRVSSWPLSPFLTGHPKQTRTDYSVTWPMRKCPPHQDTPKDPRHRPTVGS